MTPSTIRYGSYPLYEDEQPLQQWPIEGPTHRYGLGYDYDTDALGELRYGTPEKRPVRRKGEKKTEKGKEKDTSIEPDKTKEQQPIERERKTETEEADDTDSSSSSSSSDEDSSFDDDETTSDSSSWESNSEEETEQPSEDSSSGQQEEPLRNWNQELQELMDAFAIAKRKTLAFEETVRQGNEVPPDEETIECYRSLLALLTRLRQLSRDFKDIAEEIAKTIIDEMTLPSKRKTYRPRTEFAGTLMMHLGERECLHDCCFFQA